MGLPRAEKDRIRVACLTVAEQFSELPQLPLAKRVKPSTVVLPFIRDKNSLRSSAESFARFFRCSFPAQCLAGARLVWHNYQRVLVNKFNRFRA